MFTNDALPEGCPFVIGGGLVRDAILGGRPSDIDIWLPSNLNDRWLDVGNFTRYLQRNYPNADISVLFTGPGAHTTPWQTTLGDVPTNDNYGDVNNHWVIEMQVEGWPRVNFMRSMTPWTTPQAFFNGLMRAFDIDYCMFFIGWMPGQLNVNSVILPEHMTNRAINNMRMNELYWNQYRLANTSSARVEARLIKMYSKYTMQRRCVEQIVNENFVIPTEHIVAKPMLLSQAMRLLAGPTSSVYPTHFNTFDISTEEQWSRHVTETTSLFFRIKQMYLARNAQPARGQITVEGN